MSEEVKTEEVERIICTRCHVSLPAIKFKVKRCGNRQKQCVDCNEKGRKWAEAHRATACHVCAICTKKFNKLGNLQQHIAAVHEKCRDHGCETCGNLFSTAFVLQQHIRTVHEKRRDHVCACGKAFGRASNLQAHIRTVHEKRRDHVCACGKAFGKATNMERHARYCDGDPNSNKSSGERMCMRVLDELKIAYDDEHTYPDLIGEGSRNLRYDFYIEDHHLLLEYDGEAHYRPVRFGGSEEEAVENFERCQRHDRMKNEYASKNEIPLLRISFMEFDNARELIEAFIAAHSSESES